MPEERIGLGVDVEIAQAAKNIGELRKAFDDAKAKAIAIGKAFGENSEEFKKQEEVLSDLVTQFSKYGNQTRALTEAKKILAGLTEAYGANSKEAQAAARSVSHIAEEIKKAKLASDSFDAGKRFEIIGGAVQKAAGGLTALTGAMALLGGEGEETSKKILQVQAALAFSQGLKEIGGMVEAFQSLGVVIKTQVVAAFATLRGAIITTGIGALIIGIGILVAKFLEWKEAVYQAAAGQRILNDISVKAVDGYAKEVTGLKLLVAEYNNVNTSAKRKKEIQDQLQKDYPAYFGDLDKHADKEKYIKEQVDKVTQALIIQAKVQAAQGILTEKFQEVLKKQLQPETTITQWQRALASFSRTGAGNVLEKQAKKNVKGAEDEYNKFEKFITDFVTKSNVQLAGLGGDPKVKPGKTGKSDKKTDVKADPAIEAARKLNDELLALNNKFYLTKEEQVLEHYRKLREILRKGGYDTLQADIAQRREENDISFADLNEKLDAESKARYDNLIKQSQTLVPLHHEIQNVQTINEDENVKARISFAELEKDQKIRILQDIGNALTAWSDIVGQQTAVGKAMAIAGALINTYAGAAAVIGSKSTLPSPWGTIAKIAEVATIIATGLKQVKAIAAVKVPGKGGGGSSSFAGGSLATNTTGGASLNPANQSNTTILDKSSIDALANQAIRAFVVESDISNSQGRIQRIKRSAIFG